MNKIVRLFCGLDEWATVITVVVPVKNLMTRNSNQKMMLSLQYIENITHNGTWYRDFTCGSLITGNIFKNHHIRTSTLSGYIMYNI